MSQSAYFVGDISTKQGYHGSGAVYVQNMPGAVLALCDLLCPAVTLTPGALAAVQLFRILSTAARLLAVVALMSGRCPADVQALRVYRPVGKPLQYIAGVMYYI